jgi:hypothetical protein
MEVISLVYFHICTPKGCASLTVSVMSLTGNTNGSDYCMCRYVQRIIDPLIGVEMK